MKITNNQHEPQRVTLDIVFKERRTPFNEDHAKQILFNYFVSKGVEFNGENIML